MNFNSHFYLSFISYILLQKSKKFISRSVLRQDKKLNNLPSRITQAFVRIHTSHRAQCQSLGSGLSGRSRGMKRCISRRSMLSVAATTKEEMLWTGLKYREKEKKKKVRSE